MTRKESERVAARIGLIYLASGSPQLTSALTETPGRARPTCWAPVPEASCPSRDPNCRSHT
eukprot:3941169-Pyramimonas_sp.AAC.1